MSERAQLEHAMRGLIEATHAVSEITGVTVETLIIAMLAAVKREDADALLEAAKFFAPLRLPPLKMPEPPGLMPTSSQFEHFLKLIERDDPQLYKKLRNLD